MASNKRVKTVPDSTQAILTQLTVANQTDIQLVRFTNDLLVEVNPAKIHVIKRHILQLMRTQQVDLLIPFNESTVLQALFGFYQKAGVADELYQLLSLTHHVYQLQRHCIHFLQQRWDAETDLSFYFMVRQLPDAVAFMQDFLRIKFVCKTVAEAALVAQMFESMLYENYGIPFRSTLKTFPVYFEKSVERDECIDVNVFYRPEDYLKVKRSIHFTVQDAYLTQAFLNPAQDFYDYYQQKYGITNTRNISFPLEPRTQIPHNLDDTVVAAVTNHPPADFESFSARVLVVTRTLLGSGNYMNARLTLEGLCKKMPNLHIDWIVATDGDSVPATNALPPQIRYYETDALWKLFPFIRVLSQNADIVASLPNGFLIEAENSLTIPLTLSSDSILMMIAEYNTEDKFTDEMPKNYVCLRSGINAGAHSWGLIKPAPLIVPGPMDEKRALLSQDEKAATLFITRPEAPFYFAYAYHPKKNAPNHIQGIKIIDALAMFVQHAKRSNHSYIKMALPINEETIQSAIRAYPGIFNDCDIRYISTTDVSQMNRGNLLSVDVFNLFPFSNSTFRLLMDYAAAHNTPVVVTGDQSFIELFFTMTDGATFIYQLLEHKKELLAAVKSIAEEKGLSHIAHLIVQTEQGISSEEELINITEFLITNQAVLREESIQLSEVIKGQPDLVDSLARAIEACVSKKRLLHQQTEDTSYNASLTN